MICSISCPTGWLLFRRKISRSFVSIAVRFFSLGVYCGRHVPSSYERGENRSPGNQSFRLSLGPRFGSFLVDLDSEFSYLLPQSFGHRRYQPVMPRMALPPPSRRPPISWWSQLYGLLLRGFLHGTRRVSPVAQCVLVIVLSLSPRQSVSSHQSSCRNDMLPSPPEPEFGLLNLGFRGHLCVHFVTANSLAHHPEIIILLDHLPRVSFPPHMRP